MSPKAPTVSPSWRPGLFDNKVVFCTGGSGSICSGMVRALVVLGANACIVGRNADKARSVAGDIASSRAGSTVLGIGGVDVREEASVEAAVERCVRDLGGIDFVIAGAAGNFLATISNLSVNAFKSVVDIDLIGSYITVKATLPYLLTSAEKYRTDGTSAPNGTGGRFIFVTSTNYRNARLAQAHVCAAKAGVNALSDCISIEYGPKGITSNVIAPGPIAGTEGMSRLLRSENRDKAVRGVPVQRFGLIKEIADATVFLFADTGNFVNGAYIDVGGGAWRIAGGKGSGAGLAYPEILDSPALGQRRAKLESAAKI